MALSRIALVSKEWRHISRQACFWRPLVQALLPPARTNEENLVQGQGHEGYFDCVCHYGNCLTEKHVLTGESAFFEGLEMHMEVWNAGVPSGRIYSAIGPIQADIARGETPEDPPITLLRIIGPLRKEIAGLSFSTADFDPLNKQYRTLGDCFQAARSRINPLHLCV